MSKVSLKAEMAEAGLNKEKMRRDLRRIETENKNRQRQNIEMGYGGYMVADAMPVYQAYTQKIPENTNPSIIAFPNPICSLLLSDNSKL